MATATATTTNQASRILTRFMILGRWELPRLGTSGSSRAEEVAVVVVASLAAAFTFARRSEGGGALGRAGAGPGRPGIRVISLTGGLGLFHRGGHFGVLSIFGAVRASCSSSRRTIAAATECAAVILPAISEACFMPARKPW